MPAWQVVWGRAKSWWFLIQYLCLRWSPKPARLSSLFTERRVLAVYFDVLAIMWEDLRVGVIERPCTAFYIDSWGHDGAGSLPIDRAKPHFPCANPCTRVFSRILIFSGASRCQPLEWQRSAKHFYQALVMSIFRVRSQNLTGKVHRAVANGCTEWAKSHSSSCSGMRLRVSVWSGVIFHAFLNSFLISDSKLLRSVSISFASSIFRLATIFVARLREIDSCMPSS